MIQWLLNLLNKWLGKKKEEINPDFVKGQIDQLKTQNEELKKQQEEVKKEVNTPSELEDYFNRK